MGSSRRGTGWRGEDAAPGGGVGLGGGGADRVDWLLPPATAARKREEKEKIGFGGYRPAGFPLPVNLGISYQAALGFPFPP